MDPAAITVLLVEDVAGDARLVEDALARAEGVDYRIRWVEDLAAALAALPGGEFDIVVTDLGLPDALGFESVHAFVEHDLPVVVLTGSRDVSQGLQALNEGAQDYVTKEALSDDRLSRAIRYAIERHRRLASERARAERAEERLRARTRFLATAEHKLKTPLTAIVGWSSLLDDWETLSDEKRRLGIETVARSANTLRQQVDQMLEEVRAEVITQELDVRPTDVRPIVRSTALEFQALSAVHEVTAQIDGPALALADSSALHQALAHLVENAIKYSPQGGAVDLRATRTPEGLAISVSDEGRGLPENLDIFAAFTRGDGGETEGVGLGLHIVSMLVTAMDGTISAERNPTVGSTFTILLRAVD